MAYNSSHTGAQIDAAVSAVRQKETTWDNKLDKSGGTMTGPIKFDSNERSIGQNSSGAMEIAHSGGNVVLRNSSTSMTYSSTFLNFGLRTTITNVNTPYDDYDGANKKYVDDAVKPPARSVILSTTGWSDNTLTVTVTGVLADETKQMIMPMPASSSKADYDAAGIQCTGQAANSLTFSCTEVPTSDLVVYVVIQDVNYINDANSQPEPSTSPTI